MFGAVDGRGMGIWLTAEPLSPPGEFEALPFEPEFKGFRGLSHAVCARFGALYV